MLSVAPLSLARSDVAASAGVDGTVRVLSLDGGDGGGARLRGHLGPVVGVAADTGFSSIAGVRESIDVAGGRRAGAPRRTSRNPNACDVTGAPSKSNETKRHNHMPLIFVRASHCDIASPCQNACTISSVVVAHD